MRELEKPEPLRPRDGAWFALGDGQLHIGVEEPFAPARKAHPGFRWDEADLAAIAERLQDAGSAVRWDDDLADVRRFFTDDPWTNRLELLAD